MIINDDQVDNKFTAPLLSPGSHLCNHEARSVKTSVETLRCHPHCTTVRDQAFSLDLEIHFSLRAIFLFDFLFST